MLMVVGAVHVSPAQAAAPSLLTDPAMPNATKPGAAITPDGTRLYTTDFSAAKIYSTNLATNVTTTITLPGVITTSGIEMTPSGIAYVTDLDSDRLLVFNTATDMIDDSIAVGDGPRNVALSPDQTRAYVVNFFGDTVSVVNTASKAVVATVPVGDGPFDVAVSSDGRYAYVSNTYASTLSVIDTATNAVDRTIPLVSYYPLESLVLSPQDDTVYVLANSPFGGGLVTVNAASGAASAVALTAPRSLALTPDGSRLYVATDGFSGSGRGLSVFDTTTNSLVTTLATSFGIQGLVLSPNAGLLYGPGQTKLQRVDTGLRTVIFDANGGSGSMTPQAAYLSTPLSANSFVRSGYSFAGWDTASGGGGTSYQNQGLYSFAADDTLYAQWTSSSQQPGAPTITSVTPGLTSASLAFTADDSGGSSITRIEVALDDTSAVDDSTTTVASPFTLTGLAASTSYTLYMRAVNSQGPGPWSAPAALTTLAPTPPPAPPAPSPATAPRDVAASAGDESISAAWQPPVSEGSYAVTQYKATASPGGRTCLTSATTCTINGLTNGVSYTVTVQALSGAGWSPSSTASNTVVPRPSSVPSLTITGSRGSGAERSMIRVRGTSTDLAGERVTLWLSVSGRMATPAPTTARIKADGTFTWSRKFNRAAVIYAKVGTTRSNTIAIPAR